MLNVLLRCWLDESGELAVKLERRLENEVVNAVSAVGEQWDRLAARTNLVQSSWRSEPCSPLA